MYGAGTYFARDASYSLDYVSGKKQMLVAKVCMLIHRISLVLKWWFA
jgi:hypothetical protein